VRFAITGSTGFVGTALTAYLRERGYEVTRVVRSYSGVPQGERAVVWHPDRGAMEAAGLEAHDVVINLAGESVAGVWTDAKKRRILDSRVQGTTLLARTLAGLSQKPRVLFSASGFNIYGDRPPHEAVDEDTPPGAGFMAEVARAWESSTRAAEDAGIRTVHMRLGNVLAADGGLVGALKPLFRLGLGGALGSGRQVWPWIALRDVPHAVLHVLQRPEIAGPVNFVAPSPTTNQEFTDALAASVRRPAFFRVPEFAARLAPGGMAGELLLAGARVVPRRLLDSGYEFRVTSLREALALPPG
jgi:uncharacterized protein